jgi:hypothetical protein
MLSPVFFVASSVLSRTENVAAFVFVHVCPDVLGPA